MGLGKKSADWVLCLEVGEHIPQKHEDVLLHNVLDTARKGVIISWSNGGGNGHVNRRPNEYVIEEVERRGFEHVPALSKSSAPPSQILIGLGAQSWSSAGD